MHSVSDWIHIAFDNMMIDDEPSTEAAKCSATLRAHKSWNHDEMNQSTAAINTA